MNSMVNNPIRRLFLYGTVLTGILLTLYFGVSSSSVAHAQGPVTPVPNSPYFTRIPRTLSNGQSVEEIIISGPPTPPPGYEKQRAPVPLPKSNLPMGINTLTVPAYNWVFGCSSVSGAMIAAYYDRNGFPNMYTGPTNGGVMPLDNSVWGTWTDGYGATYPNLPLAASHSGVDGRATRGSIDEYWVKYMGGYQDPYITNGWTQHAWGEAIGDYMKTSQYAYGNDDGSTQFWNYSSATPLTCSQMETSTNSSGRYISTLDGTYGRKLFYQARGYTVTTCYNQKTDNVVSGGFSFAQYKAEIDAGRPVMLNLAGHTIVGVGYDDSSNTVYLNDTWNYLSGTSHYMTWGGSYSGMALQSVSIVNLQAINPVPTITSLNPSSTSAGGSAFTLTVNGTNYVSGSVVRWNGSNRTTTYVSSTQLTASIPASDIATMGSASVTVFNPTPGGGTSNAATFSITYPVPTITGLNPGIASPGGSAFTLTVNGTNYASDSVVRWNVSDRTTTYVSSTQLTASIPASDISTAGSASVTVFNPTSGLTSNAATFWIAIPQYFYLPAVQK